MELEIGEFVFSKSTDLQATQNKQSIQTLFLLGCILLQSGDIMWSVISLFELLQCLDLRVKVAVNMGQLPFVPPLPLLGHRVCVKQVHFLHVVRVKVVTILEDRKKRKSDKKKKEKENRTEESQVTNQKLELVFVRCNSFPGSMPASLSPP